MTEELKPCRDEFDKWFIDHARAPIDPWHKEFAWAVWQAALNTSVNPDAALADELAVALEEIRVNIGWKFDTLDRVQKECCLNSMWHIADKALSKYTEAMGKK